MRYKQSGLELNRVCCSHHPVRQHRPYALAADRGQREAQDVGYLLSRCSNGARRPFCWTDASHTECQAPQLPDPLVQPRHHELRRRDGEQRHLLSSSNSQTVAQERRENYVLLTLSHVHLLLLARSLDSPLLILETAAATLPKSTVAAMQRTSRTILLSTAAAASSWYRWNCLLQ